MTCCSPFNWLCHEAPTAIVAHPVSFGYFCSAMVTCHVRVTCLCLFPDTDKLLQAASQTALEKAVSAATSHAKQWAANVHPETVPAAARGAPKAPGLELEADGAVGCWVEGALVSCLCTVAAVLPKVSKIESLAQGQQGQRWSLCSCGVSVLNQGCTSVCSG